MQPKYTDSLLTPEGMKQVEMAYTQIMEPKLHPKIFVSPFRRTIQTACLMLKNRPDKAKLTLFLDPMFKEKMSN